MTISKLLQPLGTDLLPHIAAQHLLHAATDGQTGGNDEV